jgi:hypothetical protein
MSSNDKTQSLKPLSPSQRLILESPRLCKALLPEDANSSPYEILDYDATLVLHDVRGARATFHRAQRIRFAQNGVSALMDHAWGDGVLITNYQHTAGHLADSFKERGKRHLVIELERAMAQGEELEFSVERESMEMFGAENGWVTMMVEHPIRRMRRVVVFPEGRRPWNAILNVSGELTPVEIRSDLLGRAVIDVVIQSPIPHVPYTIHWLW